jgi:hypothetical protein
MIRALRHKGLTAALTAWFALALFGMGFAHRPLLSDAAMQVMLPDGSVLDICNAAGPGTAPAHKLYKPCDACRLTAAPGLPPGTAQDSARPAGLGTLLTFALPTPLLARFMGDPVARGPPSSAAFHS